MKKTVLITGASSGFGKLTTLKFQQEGWNVAATMRSPEKETELTRLENVEVFRLDVTQPPTIENAVQETIERFGNIHAVVNNAGNGGHGMFEQFKDSEVRAMFDTNFFGVLSVCRAILPKFRFQKEGTIVNVTSLAGFISGPTSCIYASTKFALEAISEGMAFEYAPLGIKVCTVAPGAFQTGFTTAYQDGTAQVDELLKPYADQLNGQIAQVIREMYANSPSPTLVADKIYECVTQTTPIRNVVGPDSEALSAALSSMPRQEVLDRFMSGQPL